MKVLFDAYTVSRNLPSNFKEADRSLFGHEVTKSFPSVHLRTGKNGQVYSQGYLCGLLGFFPVTGWFNASPKLIQKLKIAVKIFLTRLKVKTIVEFPRALIVTDEFSNGYFHWLADCLPRLWAVKSEWKDAVVILPAYTKKWPFVKESLEILGVPYVHYLEEREKAVCAEWILPEKLASTGNYHEKTLQELRDHFLNATKAGTTDAPVTNRRIYLSRAKAPWRKLANEAELQKLLEGYGFETVYFEDLSFKQQILLVSECEVMISNHGAGLTNWLFARAGTKVVEIRKSGDSENNCYFSLASALDLPYYYLLANAVQEGESSHTADLTVDIAQVKNLLDELKL